MATESNTTGVAADQEAAFGLDGNIAGALSYFPFPIVGFILLFVEDSNEFVRFHAAQAVVTVVAVFLLRFGASFLATLLGSIVGSLVGLIMMFVNLGIFLLLIFLAYKAFSGDRYELPVLGGVAESLLDKV